MCMPRLAENVFQLFGTECMLSLARGLQAAPPHDPVRGAVQHPDEGEEDSVENDERRRSVEGDGLGSLDGERLGSELAQDNVEECDQREGNRERNGFDRAWIRDAEFAQQGFDAMTDYGLPNPAQAETRQGDAELGGRKNGIKVLGCLQRELHAPPTGFLHWAQLARANLHECELGGHEKAIRGNKAEND